MNTFFKKLVLFLKLLFDEFFVLSGEFFEDKDFIYPYSYNVYSIF